MNTRLLPRTLAVLLIAASAVIVACSDSDDEPSTPVLTPSVTASATPPSESPTETATPDAGSTPAPGDCPIEVVVCNLADSLEVALSDGNYDAIIDLVQSREETCPGGQPQGAGGPFPLCEGAPQGEVRSGYQMARRYSEGWITDRDGVVQFLQTFVDGSSPDASDDQGSGALRLQAVSCVEQGDSCEQASVIFTAILDEDLREVLVFTLEVPADPETPITLLRNGIIMDDELSVLFETGGEMSGLGTVHVLD